MVPDSSPIRRRCALDEPSNRMRTLQCPAVSWRRTLSVSICAMTSSTATAVPCFFSTAAIVPSLIESPMCGTTMAGIHAAALPPSSLIVPTAEGPAHEEDEDAAAEAAAHRAEEEVLRIRCIVNQ